MTKMIIILLSTLFMVAACNKNNSKADRVKKNPQDAALAQRQTGDPKKDDKGGVVPPAGDADKAKDKSGGGSLLGSGDKNKDGSDKDVKSGEDGKDSGTVNKSGNSGGGSGAGGTPSGTTTSGASGAGKTASDKKIGGNADMMKYNSMNYSTATMTTEESKNRLIVPALLSSKDETDRKVLVYCYNAEVVKKIKEEKKTTNADEANVPELYLFPGSEALMEVKNEAVASAEKPAEDTETRSQTTFVLGVCKGAGPAEVKQNDRYDIVTLNADGVHTDYFSLDTMDRDYVEFSVTCSHDANVATKMVHKTDESKKLTLNRVTLSQGSKLAFPRPLKNKNIDPQTGKTLKEAKNLKEYGIIVCE